ncbi:ABC transporter permease [Amycolatopsis speibonae]|uniref:ABC transporter permease n=1 Tax=Amycolatopsis speibonae TaxID=1450224 RepID=A0ABV7NZQ3_9PSEU
MRERDLGLGTPRLRLRDLLKEAFLSIAGHPARSLLTTIGTILGAAAFVATLGISSTLTQQVSDVFDLRRATEVLVEPSEAARNPGDARETPAWQDPAGLAVLRGLNGVEAAGRRMTVSETPIRRTAGETSPEVKAKIMGADPGALGVIEPAVTLGRTYDEYHEKTAAPVILLPRGLADRLGIDRVGVAVFAGDRGFTVIGIFDDVQRRSETLLSPVIPFSVAEKLAVGATAEPPRRDVIIKTAPGAAQMIGGQAPLALLPTAVGAVRAVAPPDPQSLRREIEGNVTQLSLILSAVALAIGTVSIANAATAGIAARTPEIGLRRAVGAKPGHVFAQLLGETTLLGALGGIIGAMAGVVITASVSVFNGWTPVIDTGSALVASACGALAGLLAGLVPAFRAMRIQPVAALQR